MLGTRQQQPMSSEDLLTSALDDSDFDEVTAADLEELYFRYTSNPVYVLDASDTCGKVEGLVKLFGSPAGRALVESNNAASPLSNNANSSSASSSSAAQQQEDADKERDGCLVGKTRRKHCRRSSAELYKEAAALLGLACSMTDSCRCIECQARIRRLQRKNFASRRSARDKFIFKNCCQYSSLRNRLRICSLCV